MGANKKLQHVITFTLKASCTCHVIPCWKPILKTGIFLQFGKAIPFYMIAKFTKLCA